MTQEELDGRDAQGKVLSEGEGSFHALSGVLSQHCSMFTDLEALSTPQLRGFMETPL